jgi:hypothetical protein
MKKALINPIDLVDGKSVVVSVSDVQYDASLQYFWVDCSDDVQTGWLYDNGQFLLPPPPPSEAPDISQYTKEAAIRKLGYTDWVEIPSVGDVNNTPHLVNKNEFIAYRNELRKIALNPTSLVGPMPEKPVEQWSN